MLIPNSDLDFWNSDPKIHFWANLGPKYSKLSLFYLKISTHSISRMLIPNPDLDFWNFDPKIHFWANLSPKSQSCLFRLKIGTHSISRILIPNQVLLNCAPTSTQLRPPLPSAFQTPPSSFRPPPSSLQHPQQYLNQNIARNWAISPNLGQKIKIVYFDWKLAHMVFWRCWFRIQT